MFELFEISLKFYLFFFFENIQVLTRPTRLLADLRHPNYYKNIYINLYGVACELWVYVNGSLCIEFGVTKKIGSSYWLWGNTVHILSADCIWFWNHVCSSLSTINLFPLKAGACNSQFGALSFCFFFVLFLIIIRALRFLLPHCHSLGQCPPRMKQTNFQRQPSIHSKTLSYQTPQIT